jgi:[acyl-carrier-protein] S-malonyltransferase
MSKKAFVFPGQGSQFVGMGMDVYEMYPEARDIFDRANEIIGINLSKICFEGPEEELKQTQITQPAIFVHSMAIFEILKNKNYKPDAVAGHSLGEYSALVAAEAFSFEDGLKLVKIRGALMQKAGVDRPGTMAAIIGLDPEKVNEICASVQEVGIVCAANYNSPGQVVISGEIKAVHAAMEVAKEQGARRVVELVVSGAFHSPLMHAAQEGLAQALNETHIRDAQIPIYTNVSAAATSAADKIRDLLFKQLNHPVRWVEIIENMAASGVNTFYEVGPGKVLSGLIKRINSDVTSSAIGDSNDIAKL